MRQETNNMTIEDNICATLVCNGREIARVSSTGYKSLEAVMRHVLNVAGAFVGMARLTVRNTTRGWQQVKMLASASRRASRPTLVPPLQVDGQYMIPWAS